ncbi:hypothetical protein FFI89_011985 [Bradyrhizobium sp. KBS0727]|uniref:DUF5681 domain-containing protein n=1 Tax=unclassified Bradyrhizobium TaxID=2631580 RepID=UPI00110F2813|nr:MULTISPECIES: DUF5681 domain-containing protein [unclassified Bradyrhizobium]QDW37809.1 hypothetical protein FFI71_011980 [Bradyrhizobium sp. KBS0725]QDW44413.1 hypothetical protein FFI89_011985 [Bradyrhizobium sp. KBS0727]
MNDQKNDFEVGYGKPPVATRFKKGQSGNPSGKPRKIAQKLDPGKILQSIDNEEITVKIDGKEKRIQKGEVYFRQLFNKAIKGSLSDARLIASMAKKYFGLESESPGETRFIIVPDKKLASRKSS